MLINLENENSQAQLNSLILLRVPTRVKPPLLCTARVLLPVQKARNPAALAGVWGVQGPGPERSYLRGVRGAQGGNRPRRRMRRSVPFAECSPGVSGTAVLSRVFMV